MLLMKTLLTSSCVNQWGAGQPLRHAQRVAESMKDDYDKNGIVLNTSATNYIKDDIIEYELKQIKVAAYYFSLFQFSLIKTLAPFNAITSDAPLILAHNKLHTFGLGSTGTMILTPLNKNTFLFGSKEIKLPNLHQASINEVANFNTIIMNASNEKCFSNNDHFFILDDHEKTIKYPR
ncbi:DUF4238 domain-containing protein [Pectobacterium aroidearum]|uniref:DUF4238 domain-containing protein n=1 Tax=Pectobacterium aroidearum TaxID=1201031 RepID=UPI0032EBF558